MGSYEVKAKNWIPLLEQPAYTRRKLRLICIGAGYSGLILAHKIKHDYQMQDMIDLQIYDKNADIGGTWYENRYPGAACDVPAHCYVFPFEPNPDWSAFYASGPEIWQYIKKTYLKWELDEFVQLNTKVTESIWDNDKGVWKVTTCHQGKVVTEECDVLINASGFLNKWKWPKIEGLRDFQGKLLHTADWDTDYDWTDKRIAVIGNGSSGIQVLQPLQKGAKKVVNYIRNPTWIAVNYVQDLADDKTLLYSEERRKEFRENPDALYQYRKKLEHSLNGNFQKAIKGTPEQQAANKAIRLLMNQRLNDDPELIKQFVPTFGVGCRRLTPGDGYFAALQQPNCHAMWQPIIKVTEKGILTADGEEEFDLIVTATGFDVSFRPSWTMIGRNGASLAEQWQEEPKAYFGVCAVDHPNYFTYTGPNSPVAHGPLMSAMDAMTQYMLKWCRKIAEEDIKSVSPKANVVDDLSVWSQEMLSRTVWADKCVSWYKNGKATGSITALHAGSATHYRECIQDVRGEDFDIIYRSQNRFRYLGNGFTKKDLNGDDLASYLRR